jgi:MFS family permease
MVLASLAFGVVIAFAAASPVLAVALVALAAVGYASVSFLSMGNSTLQLATDQQMRGRVMALWSVAFLGSTPIGGPLIGWITAGSSARVGLAVGAVSCFVAASFGYFMVRHAHLRSIVAAGAEPPMVDLPETDD